MIDAVAPDEGLRKAAMARVGASPRARDALEQGTLFVRTSALSWLGTAGHMQAHVVVLGLSAELLGSVCAAPAVKEELERALAAALSARGYNETLADLRLVWFEGARRGTPYRDAVPVTGEMSPPEVTVEALDAYLRGSGWEGAERALEGATLEATPRRVRLRLHVDYGPDARRVLFDALTVLSTRHDGSTPDVQVRLS